jgi:hypothetical protein
LLGEITADVLMTCFICVLASRTLWVIAGSIVLAKPVVRRCVFGVVLQWNFEDLPVMS